MQRGQFAKIWLVHVDVQALALMNVAAPVCSHVHYSPLFDLPDSPGIESPNPLVIDTPIIYQAQN